MTTAVVRGMPVEMLIEKVKDAIVYAGVSQESPDHDLTFRVPVVGMELKAGAKVARRDTHTIDIILKPPTAPGTLAVRGDDVEDALVNAIDTIRAVMTSAATGTDPWVVCTSTADISFVLTKEGKISLGVEGELASEVTQTLRLSLIPD